jgi:hypothetical protein
MSQPFNHRVAQSLTDDTLRTTLNRSTGILRQRQAGAFDDTLPFSQLQEIGRARRADALGRLPALLQQLEEQARAHGIEVFWAADAAAASRYILALAKARRVRHVVRSHSAVVEEIGLDAALAQADAQVILTQLGDFILGLAGDTPVASGVSRAALAQRGDRQAVRGASGCATDAGYPGFGWHGALQAAPARAGGHLERGRRGAGGRGERRPGADRRRRSPGPGHVADPRRGHGHRAGDRQPGRPGAVSAALLAQRQRPASAGPRSADRWPPASRGRRRAARAPSGAAGQWPQRSAALGATARR